MEITAKCRLIVVALCFAHECNVGDFYENPHDVVTETIRNGHAEGVMGGAIARKFEQQFHSNGVLIFEAKTLYSYKQEGCARIAIDYTKQGISTPNGMTQVKLKTQMNYCLDGRAATTLEVAK